MDLVAQPWLNTVWGDSNPGRILCVPGGVARNVAENVSRLGRDVRLVSLVGQDALGQSLLAHTRDAGVDVSGVGVVPGGHTSTYLSVHNAQGEMELAINDMDLLERLGPERLVPHCQMLRDAEVIVVDANLTPAVLNHIFESAPSATVFADAVSVAKCLRVLPWLSRLSLLKLNRLEASSLCDQPIDTVQDALNACENLRRRGTRQVVLSLGAQGVCWADGSGQVGHCSASAVPVVNVTGAGDALLAGLVHCYFQGDSLKDSVNFAVACAELTVGCEAANRPDLTDALVRAHQKTRIASMAP